MAIEKVKAYFAQLHMEDRIIEKAESTATVELAAQALGVEPDRIAKTLSFKVSEEPIVIVMSGCSRIDNAKYKAFFHSKAKMLALEEVEPLIGHAVGGVCPFAINDGVKVYLDESLKKHATVFPACGSDNSAIEMNMDEMEKYSKAIEWIDISKEI